MAAVTPLRLLVALLCAGTMVGCSERSQPTVLPALTPSASPSSGPQSNSPAPSGSSSQPESSTAEQAEKAVRNFWDAVNRSTAENNGAILGPLYTKSCGDCQDIVDLNLEAAKKGQRVEGAEYRASQVRYLRTSQGIALVQGRITSSAGRLLSQSGKVLEVYEPTHPVTWSFQLARRNKRWLMVRMDRLG